MLSKIRGGINKSMVCCMGTSFFEFLRAWPRFVIARYDGFSCNLCWNRGRSCDSPDSFPYVTSNNFSFFSILHHLFLSFFIVFFLPLIKKERKSHSSIFQQHIFKSIFVHPLFGRSFVQRTHKRRKRVFRRIRVHIGITLFKFKLTHAARLRERTVPFAR